MNSVLIAQICHEANRAYCWSIGDKSQLPWDQAPQWQKDSAINGVNFCLLNPDAPASANHDAWLQEKVADGWVYGPIKNPGSKEHPCIVPYDKLPENQKKKDSLFKELVELLKKY